MSLLQKLRQNIFAYQINTLWFSFSWRQPKDSGVYKGRGAVMTQTGWRRDSGEGGLSSPQQHKGQSNTSSGAAARTANLALAQLQSVCSCLSLCPSHQIPNTQKIFKWLQGIMQIKWVSEHLMWKPAITSCLSLHTQWWKVKKYK